MARGETASHCLYISTELYRTREKMNVTLIHSSLILSPSLLLQHIRLLLGLEESVPLPGFSTRVFHQGFPQHWCRRRSFRRFSSSVEDISILTPLFSVCSREDTNLLPKILMVSTVVRAMMVEVLDLCKATLVTFVSLF